ncbi:MAG: DUF3037 domain-containing protein [Bacteroidetes bacterium]|nr:DUF3037 domain-containing protein [Bacteroidota bacterium]
MQEKHLFEYAVIRIVPCVEKEEFINAGIILYCASKKFLDVVYHINTTKIKAMAAALDIHEIEKRLSAFVQVAKGEKQGGTIATLPLASRFRWLAATKSTVLQTSPVHPGLCIEPHETMMQLFEKIVL